jgi:hypothetical protein
LFLVLMGFAGPIVMVPTVLLSVAVSPRSRWAKRLAVAMLGTFVGLIGGTALLILAAGMR